MLYRIPIVILAASISALFYEQIRYFVNRPLRQKSLKELWQETHPKPRKDTIRNWWQRSIDSLLYPFTRMIAVFVPINPERWTQKLYNSLIVAGTYVNPFVEFHDRNITDLYAFAVHQISRENRNNVPSEETLEITLPLHQPDFNLLPNCDGMSCTWIGQSTCFLQMGNFNILTDPIFR